MSSIPVICDNESCRAVWLSRAVSVRDQAQTTMYGCKESPCPRCGGRGSIADGTYTALSADLLRIEQYDAVVSAIRGLVEMIQHGASANDVANAVDENPYLGFLKGYIPKDWSNLAGFIAVLWFVLGWILDPPGANSPTKASRQDVQAVLDALGESLRESRLDAHKPDTTPPSQASKPSH